MKLAVIAAAIAVPLLAHSGLMVSRFCYPQMRWLSDDELIGSVVEEYRNRAQLAESAQAEMAIRSIEANRETCCGVGDDDYLTDPIPEMILEALSGNVSTVTIDDGMRNQRGEALHDIGIERVDVCGRILLRD